MDPRLGAAWIAGAPAKGELLKLGAMCGVAAQVRGTPTAARGTDAVGLVKEVEARGSCGVTCGTAEALGVCGARTRPLLTRGLKALAAGAEACALNSGAALARGAAGTRVPAMAPE